MKSPIRRIALACAISAARKLDIGFRSSVDARQEYDAPHASANSIYTGWAFNRAPPCLGSLIVLTLVPGQIGCMHGLITFAHNDEVAGP